MYATSDTSFKLSGYAIFFRIENKHQQPLRVTLPLAKSEPSHEKPISVHPADNMDYGDEIVFDIEPRDTLQISKKNGTI